MKKKFLKVKKLLLISLFSVLLMSCTTNKYQPKKIPKMDTIKERKVDITQPDTFSGDIPKTIEMEISVDGNEFFEIKHNGPEQTKLDSIKNQKNIVKKNKN